jgi:leader peptidase (prepilin peptidase)/N-methyltransferase
MVALVAVVFIDLDLRIIPDEISLGGLVYGLLTAWFDSRLGFAQALVGAGVGFCLFYGFAWVYWVLTKRSGLGGGDIKLLAMLGSFLGLKGVLTTILLSSVLGSVIGILSVVVGRWWESRHRKSGAQDEGGTELKKVSVMRESIPYGPFLVIGAIFYHLLGDTEWLRFMIPI